MKSIKKIIKLQSLLLSFGMLFLAFDTQAQDKLYSARLSVDYVKVTGQNPYFKIKTKYKGENGYEPCRLLILNVYQAIGEDSVALVGSTTTNHNGVAVYKLNKNATYAPDTSQLNTYVIKIEDNNKFKNDDKLIRFLDASLEAKIVEKDSVNNIKATLTDGLGGPIKGKKLKVNIQRLFGPLAIGKTYKTDKNGIILVPLTEPYSGVDGNVTFEVILDSKEYGTVKYLLNTSIGEPIKDLSTFDKRTMWSPPSKTPLFLLIFPNLLMLGIWAVILILVRNLYIISKS